MFKKFLEDIKDKKIVIEFVAGFVGYFLIVLVYITRLAFLNINKDVAAVIAIAFFILYFYMLFSLARKKRNYFMNGMIIGGLSVVIPTMIFVLFSIIKDFVWLWQNPQ
jgi:hypothetical protein